MAPPARPAAFPAPRPELLAFLDAIKEAPDDDTPRLILADWLEEHCDGHEAARAEYIRLQCQMAKLTSRDDCLFPLRLRARELLEQHEPTWMGPLWDVLWTWWFRRGLLTVAGQVTPLLTPPLAALAETEAYAWVETLKLDSLTALQAGHLLSRGFLDGITTLRLNGAGISEQTLRMLAMSPRLRLLRALELEGNRLRHAARMLAQAPLAPNLTYLNLSDNEIGDAGVEDIARSPLLAELTRLDLRGNGIGSAGVEALVGSPYLIRLTWLDLNRNSLVPGDWHHLRDRFGTAVTGSDGWSE